MDDVPRETFESYQRRLGSLRLRCMIEIALYGKPKTQHIRPKASLVSV